MFRLTTLTPSPFDCLEIWEPQTPGTLRAKVCRSAIGLIYHFHSYANTNIMWKQYVGFLIYLRRYVWNIITHLSVCFFGAIAPSWPEHPLSLGFYITHNDTLQSVGHLWTSDQPVAETSTWQHNTENRQTTMPLLGFESTISANEQPQTHALDRAATEIGIITQLYIKYLIGLYIKNNFWRASWLMAVYT